MISSLKIHDEIVRMLVLILWEPTAWAGNSTEGQNKMQLRKKKKKTFLTLFNFWTSALKGQLKWKPVQHRRVIKTNPMN